MPRSSSNWSSPRWVSMMDSIISYWASLPAVIASPVPSRYRSFARFLPSVFISLNAN